MKKLILGIAMLCIAFLSQAQTMLENVIVEKFNTDANGRVTYRIFIDMAPGAQLSTIFGDPDHTLRFATTTTFYNVGTTFTGNQIGDGVVNYDSYITVGAATEAQVAVPKALDTDGTVDGMMTVAPKDITIIGMSGTTAPLNVFRNVSGNTFEISNAAWASLDGAVGATAENIIMIAQITTDGAFSYDLNIQLKNAMGDAEQYFGTPAAGEFTHANLKGIFAPNVMPTVAITAPAAGSTFNTGSVTITATADAQDLYGTGDVITSVAFYAGATLIGTDNSAPYEVTYNASTEGTFVLTAVATDSEGGSTTSAPVSITVTNPAPVVSITAPSAGTVATGNITITVNATDDGSIASVQYFANGVSLGTATVAPFSLTYNASTEGVFALTAVATDEEGKTTTSAPVSITVSNPAPVVSITSPAAGTEYAIGDVVTITANATDDGSVASVTFRVGSTVIGTVNAAPYTINYTITTDGIKNLTAVATDEEGKSTTSAVVSISVPSATSYEIAVDSLACNSSDIFMVPIVRTNVLANCTGFDIELKYDKTKVQPTGEISINNDLINRLYASATTDIKNGKINISLYLNGAGGLATFNGIGQVVAVEFAKTANFRAVDTVLFTATLLESYNLYTQPVAVENGTLRTYRNANFSGSLQYWADKKAIGYDGTNLITNITASGVTVHPNAQGTFTFTNTNDSITITRDIDENTDVMPVVNGYDAYLAALVAVKDARFIPNIYQILAMDVNMDGIVSAGDVSQINQRTALLRGNFVQVGGAAKDWLFVDADAIANDPKFQISRVYPNPDGIGYSMYMVPSVDDVMSLATELDGCGVTSKTYVGIMIGDVDGNYKKLTPQNTADYALLKSESVEVASHDKVTFDMAKAVVNGNYIDVPVSISSDFAIYSLDFALQYNEKTLQFAEVISNDKNLKVVSYYNSNDNTLRLTSYKMDELAEGSAVVTVRFEVLSTDVVCNDIANVKAYLNGELVKSEVTTTKDGDILNPETLEAAIYPNPVVDVLQVVVSQESKIEVLNVLSQPIFVIEKAMPNTVYSIDVTGYAKGTYFVKVSNDTEEVVKPVIKK